ncbi:MAG TPA: hypothetical protein VGQ36_22835 [Thermoanaerobaculia bacterium]|jgi:hypothetical protein|nr:hypothetical protein [Thermoanaerobaculia bacterium]
MPARSHLVATFVLAGIASVLQAEDRPPEIAQAAFDVGVAKLPLKFQGNTVEWVLQFGTLAPQTAFETPDEYAARRQKFRSEVFAFVLDGDDVDSERAAESLVVTVLPSVSRIGARVISAFDVRRTKVAVSSRAGPAAWTRSARPIPAERGAVLATRRVWKQTQIVTSERTLEFSSRRLTFTLPMPRDRVGRSDVRVAFVCMPRLDQYDVLRDAPVSPATGATSAFDGSYRFQDEETTVFVALRVRLLQVWLFNRSTGEVYGRFTPEGVFVPRDQ